MTSIPFLVSVVAVAIPVPLNVTAVPSPVAVLFARVVDIGVPVDAVPIAEEGVPVAAVPVTFMAVAAIRIVLVPVCVKIKSFLFRLCLLYASFSAYNIHSMYVISKLLQNYYEIHN